MIILSCKSLNSNKRQDLGFLGPVSDIKLVGHLSWIRHQGSMLVTCKREENNN